MTETNHNNIIRKLTDNIIINRLLSLENNDLLVLTDYKIIHLKNPDYLIENKLEISIDNIMIYDICLWKKNQIIE